MPFSIVFRVSVNFLNYTVYFKIIGQLFMARLARVSPVGVPQHVIQRGNNRQVCFAREQDFTAYIGWLKVYSKNMR